MANYKRNKKNHHITKVGETFYFQHEGKKTSLKTKNITEARELRDKLWKRNQMLEMGIIEEEKKVPLFGAVCQEWFEFKKLKDIREEHLTNLRIRTNKYFMDSEFVNKPVNEITPLEIEKWYLKRFKEENISNNYANDLLTTLSNIFKFAVRARYISANPMSGVERPKSDGYNPNPFDKDEMYKIINATSDYFKPMITVKFFTGIRVSELFGLKWKDIDFTKQEININRSFLNREDKTKNQHSKRTIKVIPVVIEALRAQRAISMGKSEFVFINTKGEPINYKCFNTSTWAKTLIRAGVKFKAFRNTRATFISLAIAEGESLAYVANYVGHSSVKTLFKHYYAWIPKKDDGLKLEALSEGIKQPVEQEIKVRAMVR